MSKKIANYTPGAAITVRGREQSVRAVHSGHASTLDAAYDEACDGKLMLSDVLERVEMEIEIAAGRTKTPKTWRDYADAAYSAIQAAGYLLAYADRISAAHSPEADER